jgi:hypothetical protein
MWALGARFVRCRFRPHLAKFEQLQAEGLDLRKDTEQRGLILDRTSECRLAGFQL